MTDEQLEQAKKFNDSAKRLAQSVDWQAVEEFMKNYTDNHIPSMVKAEFNTTKSSFYDGQKSIFLLFEQLASGELLEQAQKAHSTAGMSIEEFANQ